MVRSTCWQGVTLACLSVAYAGQQFQCTGCFCKKTWDESTLQLQTDVEYGSAFNTHSKKTQTLLLDIYQPPKTDDRKLRPAMVVIHGGGWSSHNKTEQSFVKMAKHFAAFGFVTVSIDYRLEGYDHAPAAKEAANLDAMYDAKAAVRWLVKNSKDLRIDTSRIAAFGGSAGAATVAFMVAVPGEGDSGNPGFPSNLTVGVSLSGMLWPDKFSGIKATDPPCIDFHGTADTKIPLLAAQLTNNAMQKANATSFLVTFEGQGHVPFQTLEQHFNDLFGFLIKYMDLQGAECPHAETLSNLLV
jgi:dienelactone hydrolase